MRRPTAKDKTVAGSLLAAAKIDAEWQALHAKGEVLRDAAVVALSSRDIKPFDVIL
jgi:hypothetical protein